MFFCVSVCRMFVAEVAGGGTAEAAINPSSESRSMPRSDLLEELRRSRQVLASLGSKVGKEEGSKVQLAEQEADLMLLLAEHMEREEERKREDTFQLERVKVGKSWL